MHNNYGLATCCHFYLPFLFAFPLRIAVMEFFPKVVSQLKATLILNMSVLLEEDFEKIRKDAMPLASVHSCSVVVLRCSKTF